MLCHRTNSIGSLRTWVLRSLTTFMGSKLNTKKLKYMFVAFRFCELTFLRQSKLRLKTFIP